jgi:hypothetical protein
MAVRYIVLCAQVVGSGPFSTEYSFDGKRFMTREAAIQHGFTKGRSDDFNIGVVINGELISLDWMDKVVDATPDVISKISDQVAL